MQKSFFILLLILGSLFGLSAYGFSMSSTSEVQFNLSIPQSQLDRVAPLAVFSSQDGNQANQEGTVDEVQEVSTVKSSRMPQCNLDEDDECEASSLVPKSIEVQGMTANLPVIVDKQQVQDKADIRSASV